MAFNLVPQKADTTIFEGEGGGYYAWTAANSPAVAEAAVGAGKLVLQPRGFALPHYSDTNKIGYVVEGTCTVGFLFPNDPEEKILVIEMGDAIPVPIATISWWFNGGDSDVTIVFLGESNGSYTPGQFDYFFLTGPIGILAGFSMEFLSKIYGLSHAQSKEIANSQPNPLVIKVDADIDLPHQSNQNKDNYSINLYAMISSHAKKSKGGPSSVKITADDSPLIENIGLSLSFTTLASGIVLHPSYNMEHKVMYVIKGGGRIQIVGMNGMRVLDETIEEGQLIVLPKFFVAAFLAGEEGLKLFCVSKSSRPLSGQLGGHTSAYKVLSSSVLQAALNVSAEWVNTFNSKY